MEKIVEVERATQDELRQDLRALSQGAIRLRLEMVLEEASDLPLCGYPEAVRMTSAWSRLSKKPTVRRITAAEVMSSLDLERYFRTDISARTEEGRFILRERVPAAMHSPQVKLS